MSLQPLKPIVPLEVKLISGLVVVLLLGALTLYISRGQNQAGESPQQEQEAPGNPATSKDEPLPTGIPEPARFSKNEEENLPSPEIESQAPPEKTGADQAPEPRTTKTVDEFFSKYKDFDLQKFLGSAKPITKPPEPYAGTLTFAHAAYISTPKGEILWRQSVAGNLDTGLEADSCVSLRGAGLDVLGYLGEGNLKFYEGPEVDSNIAVLHNTHFLVTYHDHYFWDKPRPSEQILIVLYYKKDYLNRLHYQGRLTRSTNTFHSPDPKDCGYSP